MNKREYFEESIKPRENKKLDKAIEEGVEL